MNNHITRFFVRSLFVVVLFLGCRPFLTQSSAVSVITDQSRVSATKSMMSCIKSAFLAFHSDLGNCPFADSNPDEPLAYFMGQKAGLGMTNATNCLFSNEVAGFNYLGIGKEKFIKRWKGPYLDSDAEDNFFDCWGMPFVYVRHSKFLFLWSAGQDGKFDDLDVLISSHSFSGFKPGTLTFPVSTTYDGDDILVSIKRFRHTVVNSNIKKLVEWAILKRKLEKAYQPPSFLEKLWNSLGRSSHITD